MIIATTIDECRRHRAKLGELALVPTMGALHEGHLSLIRRARELAGHVAVSIFVNPAQFAPHEDLERYPRPIEQDLAQCQAQEVDLVFCPTVEQMYPPGQAEVSVTVPRLGEVLEGRVRPHHFGGVCRVVTKLLSIIRPQVACFGMKDYQQWRVIEALVAGLNLGVRIEACPTVRGPDGLALSSRNAYLGAGDRERALSLPRALDRAAALIEAGANEPEPIERMMAQALATHGVQVDYAVVRDAWRLGPVDVLDPGAEPVVLLVAGRVRAVRLIDNRPLGL
jgi:pantoate--beta-alanine ligase